MKRPPNIIVPTPRPTQGGRAAYHAVDRAQTLICMVRDESADTIGPYLDALSADQMYALVVALAAMAPDDQPAASLLSWLNAPLAVVA